MANLYHAVRHHHHREEKRPILEALAEAQLIAWNPTCQNNNRHLHGNPPCMVLYVDNDRIDGPTWRCPERQCRQRRHVRHRSIFNKIQNVALVHLVHIIYLWASDVNVKSIARLKGLARCTVIEFVQSLRLTCDFYLQQHPIQIGGQDHIVQIDESKFNHKPKNQVGRRANMELWVVGLMDAYYTPARGYLFITRTRSRRRLFPVFRRVLLPDTTVHTDEWAAYRTIQQDIGAVAQHETVNHTVNFVNPETGAHTQNIESYWNKAKLRVKAMRGVRRTDLNLYLQEFMWRDWYGQSQDEALQNILLHVREKYPLP